MAYNADAMDGAHEYTLYVDESGQFPREGDGTLGPRVVGGVLLPGTVGDHDAMLRPRLEAAFHGWPGAWHFCEVNSGAAMARSLHALRATLGDDSPWRARREAVRRFPSPQAAGLRVSRDDRALYDDLTDASMAVRDDLRATLGALPGATTLLAVEHDMRFTAGRSPAMTEALVLDALAWLTRGLRIEGPAQLSVLYHREASDARGYTPDVGALAAAVGAGAGLAPETLRCTFARSDTDARAVPGLCLADVVCCTLGPGARQSVPMTARDVAAWSLINRRMRARESFGAAQHREVDAVAMRAQLDAVLSGARTAREALAASGPWVTRGPQGSLPAAIESAHELLRGWNR